MWPALQECNYIWHRLGCFPWASFCCLPAVPLGFSAWLPALSIRIGWLLVPQGWHGVAAWSCWHRSAWTQFTSRWQLVQQGWQRVTAYFYYLLIIIGLSNDPVVVLIGHRTGSWAFFHRSPTQLRALPRNACGHGGFHFHSHAGQSTTNAPLAQALPVKAGLQERPGSQLLQTSLNANVTQLETECRGADNKTADHYSSQIDTHRT